MHLWKSSDNYMGKDYSDWFVLATQTRDSNLLEQSNFACILKFIGGESKHVQVIRLSHWGCGWIEFIGVHKDAPADLIALAESIETKLSNYPVFDEDDYSRREWEAMVSYWRSIPVWVRKRDHGATAKQARMSFSKLCRLYGCDNVYESVHAAVTE